MRFALLGAGQVGTTIASKLAQLDHEVMIGARSATNEAAAKWAATNGSLAGHITFVETARHGEMILNATAGAARSACDFCFRQRSDRQDRHGQSARQLRLTTRGHH